MTRAIITVLDSFGIGASFDADKYGDRGANTFGHIAKQCAQHPADLGRKGPLFIPHLNKLGLGLAYLASTGKHAKGIPSIQQTNGLYGYAVEQSLGKDTPSGHWEMAGLQVPYEWRIFPPEYPSFPDPLIKTFIERGALPGILGNKHASGTAIIDELGEEHIRTGKPIVYTSGDSVFQVAAHEESFGLQRLYDICSIARELVDEYKVGRVIARPFVGSVGHFKRTSHRRDYATPPHAPTLLDHIKSAQGEVIAVGKIADIFAHQGITQEIKADDNMALFDATLEALKNAGDKSLVFSNFVDFDSSYGHRRDVAGYASALEAFDARLPELFSLMHSDDILIITGDHGCDPTWPGSDHTREHVPVLIYSPSLKPGFIGRRESFADIGQTVAKHLSVEPTAYGTVIKFEKFDVVE